MLTDGVHIIHDGGSGGAYQGKYEPGQSRENILRRELIFRWLTAFKKVSKWKLWCVEDPDDLDGQHVNSS